MGMIGNSLAQGLISGANIQDGTVDTPDIKDSAVTTAKVADGAVTAAKFASGAAVANVGYTPVNKAGDQMGAGTFAKAIASTTGGNIAFDNGTADTPGVSFYSANNTNYGIDGYSGRLRVTKNINEGTGAEAGGFTSKTVYAGAADGMTTGNDIGLDTFCGSDSSGYARWRVYNGTTNVGTIHYFNNAWGGGSGEGASAGCWNLDWGTGQGISFGTWNGAPYTFTNTRALVKGDRHTIYGPNSSWGSYLRVGGNGDINPAGEASVVTTNGNLHLDPQTSRETYINWYAGSITNIGAGNGGGYGTLKYGTLQQVSDYRIKSNVASVAPGAIDAFYSIKFQQFNVNDESKTTYGVIAHELQVLLPDAVMGVKDQLHENGTALMQSVDYQQVFVLACKALQEQKATITDLTARIVALEAK